jgi:protocatechuate 3,4-dioxygenase beta subunit
MSAPARYRPVPRDLHPPNDSPEYHSTLLRCPRQPLVAIPQTLSEITGPVAVHGRIGPVDHDLTRQHAGAPLGERIILEGRVLDEGGGPVTETLVELWQCNAAGRYAHRGDEHDAPLDPNFTGAGRTLTDAEGRYRFITIKPGAYPWRNHPNAWRPAHIHLSVFGSSFLTRLITQMFFPGDPLLAFDPIFNSVPEGARASWPPSTSASRRAEWALGTASTWCCAAAGHSVVEALGCPIPRRRKRSGPSSITPCPSRGGILVRPGTQGSASSSKARCETGRRARGRRAHPSWQADAGGRYHHPEDRRSQPWTKSSTASAACPRPTTAAS